MAVLAPSCSPSGAQQVLLIMNSAPGLAHQELPTGTADTSAQLGFDGYLSLGTRFEECHCMRGQQGRQGHIHARADAHDNASLELLSGLQCSIESSQLAGQELMRQFHRQGPFEASQPSEGQTSNCSCCCLPAGSAPDLGASAPGAGTTLHHKSLLMLA